MEYYKIKLSEAQENLLAGMKIINGNDKLYNIGNIRGIGITTALLKYCSLNGYALIVANKHTQSRLIGEYKFENIFYPSNIREVLDGEKCVVDVGVDLDVVRLNCNVVGGVIDLNGYEKYGDNIKYKNKITDEISMSTNLVDILNNEINCLIKKIEKAREGDNIGTYKNLIIALKDVVKLRNEELSNDYKLIYSEYRTEVSGDNQGNVNYQKQVAVWEQNGDGLIRNHKVWNVQDDNINCNKSLSEKIKLPKEVKETIDFCKSKGYSKYSMTNFVGMPKDFPKEYEILKNYFFSNHENYLKAILYDNYYCEVRE